ncbi:ATP synthase mitochondrial F1 complex assembly factor 2 [Brachionus plicatilis]|uniref:ATP synthase mitochondrial F1 complex assembly factor 2 n=1 Tax=Brachionus plicatilis TaxID=10195 RepID=A0A3M7Q267_BRAPC|nr:ATP synthase mitochondrial F1 complex assembly factor 2 [Brachionus plicatilis]
MSTFFARRIQLLGNLGKQLNKAPISSFVLTRQLSTSANRKERKRFYRQVSLAESFGSGPKMYEINLDKKKLKTPGANLFTVDNELLGQMVSFEWQSQKEYIKQYTMHLTSLVNTCIDNPGKLTKEVLMSSLNDYLQTDTLIYFDSNSIAKLDHLQETKWRPLVDWFNQKFPDLNLKIKKEIDNEDIFNFSQTEVFNPDMNSFVKYLNKNFDLNTMIAFNYIAECLKSVILTVALLERKIESVEEACDLAVLEQQHQYDQWGKVEWYHDINEAELRSRVSAAVLFIYLSNNSKYLVKKNLNYTNLQ